MEIPSRHAAMKTLSYQQNMVTPECNFVLRVHAMQSSPSLHNAPTVLTSSTAPGVAVVGQVNGSYLHGDALRAITNFHCDEDVTRDIGEKGQANNTTWSRRAVQEAAIVVAFVECSELCERAA